MDIVSIAKWITDSTSYMGGWLFSAYLILRALRWSWHNLKNK